MGIYWFWHGPAGLYWSNWKGRYRVLGVLGCTCWIFFLLHDIPLELSSNLREQSKINSRTSFFLMVNSACNTNQRKISICGYLPFISVSLPHRANSNQKLYWIFLCVCLCVCCYAAFLIFYFLFLCSYCSPIYTVPHMLNVNGYLCQSS